MAHRKQRQRLANSFQKLVDLSQPARYRWLVPIIVRSMFWRIRIFLTTPAENIERNQKTLNIKLVQVVRELKVITRTVTIQ